MDLEKYEGALELKTLLSKNAHCLLFQKPPATTSKQAPSSLIKGKIIIIIVANHYYSGLNY